MNRRTRTNLMAFAAATLAVGAVAIVVGGLLLPVDEVGDRSPTQNEHVETVGDSAEENAPPAGPSMEELQRLCAIDLRKPLDADSADAAPESAASAGAPLPVQLIGTIHEPGHSMAMLRKANGTIEVCAEGDRVEEGAVSVQVTRVERDKITVKFDGASRELVVPPPTPLEGASTP